jgi:hypothetical protein
MKFGEIVSRMEGFTPPVFGVSWQPATQDVTVARSIISYLEDRRVLYEPYEVETPQRCIESVIRIREFLTDVLTGQAVGADLTASVQAMRAACRKFLRAVDQRSGGPIGREFAEYNTDTGEYRPIPWDPVPNMNDVEFNQALGELRGVFGIHVGMLAAKYGFDVEDELASILPEAD